MPAPQPGAAAWRAHARCTASAGLCWLFCQSLGCSPLSSLARLLLMVVLVSVNSVLHRSVKARIISVFVNIA